ncbi:phage tail protein [Escherichia marmotae]|nr:phage tail protein [Escherichia marmotae]
MMPATRYLCIFTNLGLGEAAKREVGTGANQIPDMASFTSGPGWMKFPDGTIIQFGVSIAGPIGYPTTINFPIPFTSGYRIATSFDSAINGATDCPAFATTPAGGGLLAFYLMSSRTGGTGAGANWIAIGK